MDASLTFDVSETPVFVMAERIKRARAALLRCGGSDSFLVVHRMIDYEHADSLSCRCRPITISQHDYRPSLFFAHEVLYPTVH